jgi:hypothetical protein
MVSHGNLDRFTEALRNAGDVSVVPLCLRRSAVGR